MEPRKERQLLMISSRPKPRLLLLKGMLVLRLEKRNGSALWLRLRRSVKKRSQ